jgi:hypothetical protein
VLLGVVGQQPVHLAADESRLDGDGASALLRARAEAQEAARQVAPEAEARAWRHWALVPELAQRARRPLRARTLI